MASVLHVAVGLAAARGHDRAARALGGGRPPAVRFSLLALLAAVLACLPDADVIGFRLGIPYEAPLGHRGASHSLLVAAGLALLVALAVAAATRRSGRAHAAWLAGGLVAACLGSHGLLDAMTDGGHGIALLWPLTAERFFLPWRPIPVSPIGVSIVSVRGAIVLGVELAASVPLLAWALWPRREADAPR